MLEVGPIDGYLTSGARAIWWNDMTRGSPPELWSSWQPRNRGKCPIVDWLDEELNVQSFVLSGGETKAGLCVSSSEDTIGGRKQRCLREDARWAKEEPSQVFNYWMAQEAWMCNHLHLQVGQIEEPCPSELRSSWQLRIEASVQLLIGSTKDWMYNYSRRGWERPTQGSKPNKGVTRGSTPEPERLGWKEIWRHLQGFEQLLLDIEGLLNCE